jgi:tetratricopeptide (TPR) repeat protein
MYFLAKVLALDGKLEEAEQKFRRLIALAPERPGTRMVLAKLLLDRGLFESAEIEYLQAIDTFPEAFERFTAVRRITPADAPLIERMQALADAPPDSAAIGFESRIAVGFGLGKAFDDLGDYAQAIRYYDIANRRKASTIRLDRQSVERAYDETIARYGKDTLDGAVARLARSPNPEGDLPVFIVGMPRSGTTLTEQILSSHPAVAASGELPFWQNQLAAWTLSRDGLPDTAALWKAADEYLAVLRAAGASALRVTDKQPLNFELLWLIRLAFPEARIVHCRRNPVDTCLSIYFSYFGSQQDYAFDRGDLVFQYRQYERLMENWRKVLPQNRFMEVDYETLIGDREAETRRLVAFLGLDWDDACLAPERNRRSIKTASVWQARQPVYGTSVERWRHYEPWLQELRELMREPASARGSDVELLGA